MFTPGRTAWTFFGWSPGLRRLWCGQLLSCGCLVGVYETTQGGAVTIVDHVGTGCTDATHAVNLVLDWHERAPDSSGGVRRGSAPGTAWRSVTQLVLLGAWILASAASAGAQTPDPAPMALPEDLEPHLVGSRIGPSGDIGMTLARLGVEGANAADDILDTTGTRPSP
jgi:hypothetical protein